MQRNQMLASDERFTGREPRQVISILGIILTGIVAAILLPLWMAAPLLLLAVGAIRIIAAPEPVVEPVVIRHDERC